MPELDLQINAEPLFAAMQKAVDELNTEGRKALAWGGGTLCQSLRAATKKAPEKRKLLTWQEDGRTRYGMHIWSRGRQLRREINALHPGVVPFKSHTTGQPLGRDKWTDEVHKIERYTYDKTKMENHPWLTIDKAGLAKKAWAIARGVLIATAYGDTVRTRRPVASVEWRGTLAEPTVVISNHLDYAVPALKEGEKSITEALGKAARMLEGRIAKELKNRGLAE